MIEKIHVSRDEVLPYPWLDSTEMHIYFDANGITRVPMYRETVLLILKHGIKTIGPKVLEELNKNSIFKSQGSTKIRSTCEKTYIRVSIE